MPKATKDGVVEIDGTPFFVKAGDDYPEGAKFREQDPPPPEEKQPEPESAPKTSAR